MIREYGIDPESINGFEKFFRIISFFGISNLRLIRKYPSKWSNLIIKANDNLPDREKHKLIEKLNSIDSQLIQCNISINGNPSYNGNIMWLENAECYHNHFPFDAIISNTNPRAHNHVILADLLTDLDPLMNVSNCYNVRRNAIDMAASIKSILENAKEIHFVDPHLRGMQNRHLRPLKEFLNIIYNRTNRIPVQKVFYHTGDTDITNNDLSVELERRIKPVLPNGASLKLKRWPTDLMHNRFVLTNLGGFMFGIGLDDNNYNNIEYDTITPIPPSVCYLQKCDQQTNYYMDANLNEDFTIENI
jgi:hypothetical protein